MSCRLNGAASPPTIRPGATAPHSFGRDSEKTRQQVKTYLVCLRILISREAQPVGGEWHKRIAALTHAPSRHPGIDVCQAISAPPLPHTDRPSAPYLPNRTNVTQYA